MTYDSERLSRAQPEAGLDDVYAGVRDFVQTILALSDAAFTVARVQDWTHEDFLGNYEIDQERRDEVLGDPYRYVHIGPARPLEDSGGFDGRSKFRFMVNLLYGIGEVDRETATTAFRSLLYSSASATPGIIYAARNYGPITVATDHELEFSYEAGSVVEEELQAADLDQNVYFLEAWFVLTAG